MTARLKKITANRATARMVIGGVLFVLGWWLLVSATQYLTTPPLVRELGNLLEFKQDVIPNRANTRLVFCQDTAAGVGIYYCDTAGGKPRLLCEQKETGHSWKRFTMLGWSPDDSRFACAWPDDKQDKEWILIFDGRTGEPLGKVVADENLYQFGWLGADAFAYSSRTAVRVVTRQADGSWVHQRSFHEVATNLDDFTTVSANSVAWREGGGIWLLDLATGVPEKIWEATTDQLVEFTYAWGADEFLLNCSDAAGQYLLRFRPQDKRTINQERIGDPGDYIRKATWDGRGSSYAYLTNDLAGSAFCLKAGEMAAPIIIPWRGGVRSFTLSGGQLFFSGNPDDQAPGIWVYDLKAETFKLIVASTSGPLRHGLGRPSTCRVMTNALGGQRIYHLWSPPKVSPGQKYPVLLAQELNTWFPYFQLAAHSGYYVAVVDRPFSHTWDGALEHTWAEDVSRLAELMAHDPNVDTNRIFLYACSRDTSGLSQLVAARPTLAKGFIAFGPTALPDPAGLRNKSVLLVAGNADVNAAKGLSEFQDRAAKEGNAAALFLQAGAGHMAASGTTERNRARQFAKFLTEQ